MHSDAFLATGSSHAICQDYAYAGKIDHKSVGELPFVVVSDGCSSSPDTDIGSRLLARSMADIVKRHPTHQHMPGMIQDKVCSMMGTAAYAANRHASGLGLPASSLDATLMYAQHVLDGVLVAVSGDGYVLARHREVGFLIFEISLESSAPDYLSYAFDQDRYAQYMKEFGRKKTITTYALEKDKFVKGNTETVEAMIWTRVFSENYDLVLIASDGIGTFEHIDLDTGRRSSLCMEYVLRELTSFKGLRGQFLQRRLKKFMKKCREMNDSNFDDISIGGIVLD